MGAALIWNLGLSWPNPPGGSCEHPVTNCKRTRHLFPSETRYYGPKPFQSLKKTKILKLLCKIFQRKKMLNIAKEEKIEKINEVILGLEVVGMIILISIYLILTRRNGFGRTLKNCGVDPLTMW